LVESDATVATELDTKTVVHVDMVSNTTENDAECAAEAAVEHVEVVAEADRKTVQHARQPGNLFISFNLQLTLKEFWF